MKTEIKTCTYFCVVFFGLLFGNILISQGSIDNNKYCQTIDVREMVMRDTNIYILLDSIIDTEQSINIHFTDSTVFGVWVEDSSNNESLLITISGSENLNILLQIGDVEGFFKYRGHIFIIMTACSKLFIESNQYQTLNIDPSVEIYEDDRWPFHY
ncbi:MAG: hypothetical protein Q8O72_05215, partial [Bacteroidales bacterium]|nr:hypothetical protein [Bacteroidales bacterium]